MSTRHSVRMVIASVGAVLVVTGCGINRARRLAGSDITLPQSTTAMLLQQLSAPCDDNVPTSTTQKDKRPTCAVAPSDTTDRHAGPQTTQKRP